MAQWLRGHVSEPKGHEFEPHRCHLVRAYGRLYVQVRPVRPKISHFKNKKEPKLKFQFHPAKCICHQLDR